MMKMTKSGFASMMRGLRNFSQCFTVEFTKKDGTHRVMNCRMGVRKHLKGGDLNYNPVEKGLLTVFDMQKNAYRCVPLDRVKKARIDKHEIEVVAG